MAKKNIELGSKVKDTITGFSGIVTGRTQWLTGCVQFVVSPEKLQKDGTLRSGEWFDEGRLEVLAPPSRKLASMAAGQIEASPGGPQVYPRRRIG